MLDSEGTHLTRAQVHLETIEDVFGAFGHISSPEKKVFGVQKDLLGVDLVENVQHHQERLPSSGALATMTTCASVEAHASGSPRTVASTEPDKSRFRLFLKEATELLESLCQDLADLARSARKELLDLTSCGSAPTAYTAVSRTASMMEAAPPPPPVPVPAPAPAPVSAPTSPPQSSTFGAAAAVSSSTTAASNSSLPGAELVSNSSLPGAELVSESDLRMLADAQAAGDAFAEQRRMIEDLVNDPVVFGGLVALRVEHNRYSLPGSPMYERFVAARAGKPPPPLRIVFHGTDDENIEPILANGMDPSRRGMHDGFLTRPCHVHGPGEYFVTRALRCVFFAFMDRPFRLTGRLLIFLVSEKEVLPQAPDVVVVNDVSRELPLGTVTFQMADAKVSELDEKARKAKAAAERAKSLAEQAMQKARIMQMLIRGDIHEASEMYEAVTRAREREGEARQSSVPLWAHELRVYLRDVERECVVALFPGVIPVRHDSRTGLFCADESFKWPPTVTDMSQSEYSPSAGKQRLDDTGRDDIDEAVLKERAAKLEAKAVDAKARAQAARRNMLADAQAAGDAFAEQRRMIEDLVNDPVVFGGLVALQVEHNRYSLPGSPMYERFVATRAGKPPPPLRIVFHGTDDENIEPILANGMDPSRRGMHGQVHGPGEYFATCALTSVRFALRNRPGRLTGRLLIFLVSEKEVLPQAPDVVVVNDVSRELPLGTVTFQMADAKVSELDEKARKAKAAAERAKAAAERTNSTVPLQTQVPPSHTQVPLGESRSSEGHQASSGVIGRHQASSGESRSSEEALRRALGRRHAPRSTVTNHNHTVTNLNPLGGRHAPRSTVVAVMKELKRFHQGSRGGSGRCVERDATDGTADDADADDDFRALLLDDADVLRWRVEMRLPPDSLLGAQLAAHAARWGGGAVVELEVLFGDDFPASPPFVRVVSPRFAFHTGHVTVGGSICMQLLTTSGWDSSFTVEAALVMVRDAMLSGHGALDSSRAHYGAQPPLPTGT